VSIALLFIAFAIVGYYSTGIDFSAQHPRKLNLKPFGIVSEDENPVAYWAFAIGLVGADIGLLLAIIWWFASR